MRWQYLHKFTFFSFRLHFIFHSYIYFFDVWICCLEKKKLRSRYQVVHTIAPFNLLITLYTFMQSFDHFCPSDRFTSLFHLSSHPLACGTAFVGLIGSILLCQLTACFEGSIVDGFKDLNIEFLGFWTLKWKPHQNESVGKPLNSDADGTMPHIGHLSLKTRQNIKSGRF